MLSISDASSFDGETITVDFAPTVTPSGDPHTDAENVERAQAEAVRFEFTTRVLPGAMWESLLRKHPPTERGNDYNPDTFPPAIIAESVTGWTISRGTDILEREDRPPTVDEAVELWQEWPQWARARLFRALERQNVLGPSLGKAR